jgi:RNA polymerase sigma factor, sigma-70 family
VKRWSAVVKRPRINDISESNSIQNRFTAYLINAAKRHRYQYINRQRVRASLETDFDEGFLVRELVTDDDSMEMLAECKMIDERLSKALAVLKDRERLIVWKRVVYKRPFLRIASDLGQQYSTVKSVYRRALIKMRKVL